MIERTLGWARADEFQHHGEQCIVTAIVGGVINHQPSTSPVGGTDACVDASVLDVEDHEKRSPWRVLLALSRRPYDKLNLCSNYFDLCTDLLLLSFFFELVPGGWIQLIHLTLQGTTHGGLIILVAFSFL